MSLEIRPLPGFPENYATACRRSPDRPIRDTYNVQLAAVMRFGEWDQPISLDLARQIFQVLRTIRIPLDGGGMAIICIDGPAVTRTTLIVGGATFEWEGLAGYGWEPLE